MDKAGELGETLVGGEVSRPSLRGGDLQQPVGGLGLGAETAGLPCRGGGQPQADRRLGARTTGHPSASAARRSVSGSAPSRSSASGHGPVESRNNLATVGITGVHATQGARGSGSLLGQPRQLGDVAEDDPVRAQVALGLRLVQERAQILDPAPGGSCTAGPSPTATPEAEPPPATP